MAVQRPYFGIDISDLIYTNEDLVDEGTLETYNLDLDLAKDKTFELQTADAILPLGSIFYVEDTEIGGIIDGYSSSTEDNGIITYTGRSWRGVIGSKYAFGENGKRKIVLNGKAQKVITTLLSTYDLSYFFVCDPINEAELGEVSTSVEMDVVNGANMYDLITAIGEECGINFKYIYRPKDKKVHIVPYVAYDWSDYLIYAKDDSVNITMENNRGSFPTHLVISGIDETGKRRMIHMFLDSEGKVKPYTTTGKEGTEDSEYILDQRNKTATGAQEIVEYIDAGQIQVEENYKKLYMKSLLTDAEYQKYYEFFSKYLDSLKQE